MSEKISSVAIGEIVAKAMQDEDLKKSLLADPNKVLSDAGAASSGVTYKVVEDSATSKNIILPFQPLTDTMKVDTLPDGASPAIITRYIITKAQADDAFKGKVLSNINEVLQDLGVTLPEGITLKIVANSDSEQYVVIPYVPPVSGELSDDQLAAVAGGKSHVAANTNVAANAEAAINAVAATEGAAVADVAAAAQVAAAAEAAAAAVAVVVLT